MSKTQIRASNDHNELLHRLKSEGVIAEMSDGFRFAIALALAHGGIAPSVPKPNENFISNSTLDPDRSVESAIRNFHECGDNDVYEIAERLAAWGMNKLEEADRAGALSFSDLISEANP
jgi:hypothetical protein